MPSHSWLKGQEIAEEERQMESINESLARVARRESIARGLAREWYSDSRGTQSDDVVIEPPDEPVESVDGGYWVLARVWVDADAVEERMET